MASSRCLAVMLVLLLCLLGTHAGPEDDRMAEMFNGKQFGRGKEKKAPATKADIPFIRCGVCEAIVMKALAAVTEERKDSKQMHESDIMEDLEAMCDPDTDGGDWINFLDLQEEGTKLNVVPMGKPGECGTECRTIARACENILEDADNVEFSQALWKASKRSDQLSQKWALTDMLCKEQTDACTKKVPPLPKDRAPGPAFKALKEEDMSLRSTMRAMKKAGLGGTLFNRDEILSMGEDKFKMPKGEDAEGEL